MDIARRSREACRRLSTTRPKCRGLRTSPDILYRLSVVTAAERRTLRVIRRIGVVRPSDLEAHGIPRQRMYRLVRKGQVTRHARGIYAAADHPYTAEHSLAQVATRV